MLTVKTNIETFRFRDDDDIRDPLNGLIQRNELGRRMAARFNCYGWRITTTGQGMFTVNFGNRDGGRGLSVRGSRDVFSIY